MTQDLYYYETGYIDESYFVYTADAESLQSSAFTISTTADNIKGTSIALTSQFTQTISIGLIKEAVAELVANSSVSATISHINGADLFAMTNASLEAQVDRIRDNNVEASAQFDIATSGQRIRYASSEEDAAFSFDIANLRVRNEEAAIDAAFSLAAINDRIKDGSASLTSLVSQSINEQYCKLASADLSSSGSLDCEATKLGGGVIVEAIGTWTSTATISASVDRLGDLRAELSSNFTQTSSEDYLRFATATISSIFVETISAERSRNNSVVLNSNTSLDTNAYNIKQFSISLDTAFSPSLTIDIFRNSFAILDATSQVSADPVKTTSNIIDSSSQFTVNCAAERVRNVVLNQQVTSSISCANSRIREDSANLTSQATLVAENYRIVQFAAVEYAAFSPNVICSAVKNSFAVLDSTANLNANAKVIRNGISNLNSAFIQTSNVTQFAKFWINQESYNSSGDFYNSVIDSLGNIYVLHSQELYKYDTYGSVIWKKQISNARIFEIVIDSTDNIYICGYITSGSLNQGFLAKYDTSGNVQWQKQLTSSSINIRFSGVTYDSSGNIYVTGINDTTTTQGIIAKYTSTGTLSWQKKIDLRSQKIVVDSSGNIYLIGDTGSSNFVYLYKFTTSGTASWTRQLSVSISSVTQTLVQTDLTIDNSNNLYIKLGAYSNYSNVFIKIDSSGNLLWNKVYPSDTMIGNGGIYYSNSKLYFAFGANTNINYYGALDSTTGNIVYYNNFSKPTTTFRLYFNGILVNNDTLYIAGMDYITVTPQLLNGLVLKLPANGSGVPENTYVITPSTKTETTSKSFGFSTITNPTVNTTTYTLSNSSTSLTNITGATSNNISIDNFGIDKVFDATLNSSVILNCEPTKQFGVITANLQSTASLSAVISRVKSASANLQVTATELVAIGRIRPFVDLQVSAFTLAASGQVIRKAQATLQSTANISATITKNIGPITADLNSNVSLSASADVISGAVINLQAFATELVVNARIRAEVADLQSNFNLMAIANKTREGAANLDSTATINAQVKKIISPTINLESTATLTASAEHTVPFSSTESSQFTVNCTIKKTSRTSVQLSSQAALSATLPNRTRDISVNLQAFVSELTLGDRSRDIIANLTSTAQLHISVTVITVTNKADLVSTSSLVCSAGRIRPVVANLTADSALISNAGKRVEAQANLQVDGFELVVATVIRIDPFLTYKIPREIRLSSIALETRDYAISFENRSSGIKQETNAYIIPFEDRKFTI